NMEGALVGGWVVLFGKTEQVNGPVSYAISAGTLTQHLAVDLIPNSSYQVNLTDMSDDVVVSSTAETSGQGSLRFSVPAGNYRVTLIPSSSAGFLNSLLVDPTYLLGGSSSTGTVNLSEAAPSGGAVVSLSRDNAAVA